MWSPNLCHTEVEPLHTPNQFPEVWEHDEPPLVFETKPWVEVNEASVLRVVEGSGWLHSSEVP